MPKKKKKYLKKYKLWRSIKKQIENKKHVKSINTHKELLVRSPTSISEKEKV